MINHNEIYQGEINNGEIPLQRAHIKALANVIKLDITVSLLAMRNIQKFFLLEKKDP